MLSSFFGKWKYDLVGGGVDSERSTRRLSSRRKWVLTATLTSILLGSLMIMLHVEFSFDQARDAFTTTLDVKPGVVAGDTTNTTFPKRPRYFFAMNFYNNEAILPYLFAEMLNVVEELGRDRVFVSVYENGSKDRTKSLLAMFNEELNKRGIDHLHRIEFLASVRRQAMKPLYDMENAGEPRFDVVLFFNDIWFETIDVLTLIDQHGKQGAHMTCGLDYEWLDDKSWFYDFFVMRDANGARVGNRHEDLLKNDPDNQRRYLANLPVQVQCCWNGLAVLNATPFYPPYNVHFRRNDQAHGECDASECSYICNDFARHGFGRVMMVPEVRVAYTHTIWNKVKGVFPRTFTANDRQPSEEGPAQVEEATASAQKEDAREEGANVLSSKQEHSDKEEAGMSELISWKPWTDHFWCIPAYQPDELGPKVDHWAPVAV
ncbi:hypothetical protein BZG36_05480 [Bifiguratus adelaidae]|uniref:Glycosyltransferase family 69 protein n=1 Tax=Bifiguratus adelaidae TaxID=1938954 RepID=A0A261XTV1_9FUNG|nr:hypothetical protein BZG36_05480 [Bifiguratus adelaidae]